MKFIANIVFCLILGVCFSQPAYAQLPGWDNRVEVLVDNSSNTNALINHQILIEINTQTLIAAGKMQADGDDIRFLDSDDTTILNYWIESGINTINTRVWVKVPSIPSSGSKTIYFYYGNDTASAASSLSGAMVSGEAGMATAGSSFTTVNLSGTYTDPVVITSYLEGSDNKDVSVKVKNAGANSFQVKLQNPSGQSFNSDTIYYFVLESGQFESLEGVLFEAAKYTSSNIIGGRSGDNSWGSISFSHSYTTAPVVFSQVMSENDSGWVTEAIRNVTTTGAQSSMERAELSGNHADETMGWVAIKKDGVGTINGIDFETLTSGRNVAGHDNGNYATAFTQEYTSAPLVISDMRERNGNNGGWIAIESISTTSFYQHVEEDQVRDSERSHTSEDTSILVLSAAGQIALRKYASPQPTTSILLPIYQLKVTSSSQTILEDQPSSLITVQTQDELGTVRNVSSDTTIALSSSSEGGEFSENDFPFIPVASVTIPSGSNSVSFYYRDSVVGSSVITASEDPSQGWQDAQQTMTVQAVNRPGAYKILVDIDNTSCGSNLTDHQVLVLLDTQSPISVGKMQPDGADIRIYDEDDTTKLNYWIESGINTASTRIWVKVPSIAANSTKTIYVYYSGETLAAESDLNETMILGEVGSTTASSGYQSVSFLSNLTNPVVVASYVEGTDNEEVSTRVRNVTSSGFDIKLHHPGGNSFNADTVYYLALEEGVFSTLEDDLWEAHRYTESHVVGKWSTDNSWGSISFSHAFASAPVVFSQVLTENDPGWITEAIRNVNTSGAQSAMERAEVSGDHGDEVIGWVAAEDSASGSINSILYETTTSGDNVRGHDNGNYTKSFTQTFSSAPIVITDMRRRDGGDGGWASIESVAAGSFRQHIEEDRTKDSERNHTTEDTSVMAFGSAGQLVFRAYVCATQPQTSSGSEQVNITKLVFTTAEQTLRQNEISGVMTIQAQDIQGSPVQVGADTVVELVSSSSQGEFSETASFAGTIDQVTIPSGSSEVEVYYRDSDVGTPVLTASEYPSQGWTDASQTLTVLSGANNFLVAVDPEQIAGQEFTMTVTALDENGDIATSFNEPVNVLVDYINPVSGSGDLSVTEASFFINGVATISDQVFSNCGTIRIRAEKQGDSSKAGRSLDVFFAPASFSVVLDDLDGSSRHAVNKPFTLDVSAQTAAGDICSDYPGPANVSVNYTEPASDQDGSVNPGQLEAADWSGGRAIVTDALYDRYGEVTVTCQDDTLTTQSGESDAVWFVPAELSLVVSDYPASRSFFYVEEPFELSVFARDFEGNVIENYQGAVSFNGPSFALPTDYTFSSEDQGTQTFDVSAGLSAVEQEKIEIEDIRFATVRGETAPLDIKDASIQVFSNQGPVGSLPITIAIVDEEGNIISEDDATFFTIELIESADDNSAGSEATETPSIMTAGSAQIVITDNQAETVTLIPSSTPVLKAVEGTATFGTVSGTGLGIKVYRELKEKEYE